MTDVTRDSPTDARDKIGDLAPQFARMTDELLYDTIWNDDALSRRDRSLITVASLTSLYRVEQIGIHLDRALDNGVTRDELIAAIHHLAFYTGWPAAFTAMSHLKRVVNQRD